MNKYILISPFGLRRSFIRTCLDRMVSGTNTSVLLSFRFLLLRTICSKIRGDILPNAFFVYLLPGFVFFQYSTMGWIRVVSITAAICVILTSALLMSFTMLLAHKIRLKREVFRDYVSLLAFWLTLEFFV